MNKVEKAYVITINFLDEHALYMLIENGSLFKLECRNYKTALST